MAAKTKKALSPDQTEKLLETLQARFEKNTHRHPKLKWSDVRARLLKADPAKLRSLSEMERACGRAERVTPRGIRVAEQALIDGPPETPKGRTSVCYDRAGLNSRKEHKPKDTAIDMAAAMGVELLSESEYRALQALAKK